MEAAQAHGARWPGRRAGSLGHAATFSFYPRRTWGGTGDGGMVVTDEGTVADRLRLLWNYGQREKYRSDSIGHNHRLDTTQAAVLRAKLPHLATWNSERRAHASRYEQALQGLPLALPGQHEGNEHVWHLYVVRVPDRVRARLAEQGIETGVHYPIPIHLQPVHADLEHRAGDFPVTERHASEILSLPMYPELPQGSAERVAEALHVALSEADG